MNDILIAIENHPMAFFALALAFFFFFFFF